MRFWDLWFIVFVKFGKVLDIIYSNIILYEVPDIVNFPWLVVGYFCITNKILELCTGMCLSYLEVV